MIKLNSEETIRRKVERVDASLIEAARQFDTATLHEAGGKIGVMPHEIKPLASSFRVYGSACTVQSPGGDNLWLHRAIYAAEPGDVLVVHVNDKYDHGYWGEIMATAAQVRGLAGLVIDGCVRDGALLREMPFPIFARGLCIRGTGKDFGARGWVNYPVLFGGVTVNAGDLVVGDEDGVVIVPRQAASQVLAAAAKRVTFEREVISRLQQGETTLSIYGLE
ncbi:4-carboxy-4-hydroxy-2-oxoadipate aldolase/oxaloacetate decarboxylase [Steroidobacter sp.]|uniref:4-carboxy-4-hydroxy-2-oxoadipate aldolase/oxaloacetate decarboxylase n=1 Tax=Steroidobacter sp. TaxID=1978227 RepID=UPI001A3C8FCB|nr:4-carboxy-4-hydroxy-2-oxoadipate aldolase/oxaloacetate decarboxylase [Steroidobacter sp.]MBL8267610.1 4-carboxy-4-hydroxy-2-oxoadipate aldolase/oxaloacetate decarboxylase [Steroidobacter sp.]